MKKLSGLIIVLLVLILGGAYVAGILTQKELKSTMTNMNNLDETQGLSAHLSNYQRGWFKSTATLDWKLHIPEQQTEATATQAATVMPARDFEFHLPITIFHGPVIIANDTVKFGLGYATTEIKLPAEYEKQFNEVFTETSEKPRLDISIFVNYLKQSEVNFAIPAFKATTKDNIKFEWKGLSSMLSVSRDANDMDGNFVIEGLEIIKNNNDKLTMGKFETEYDLSRTPSTFYVGSTNINFSHITLEQAGKTTFSIKDFYLDSDSSIDDHLFEANLTTSLEKLDADNKVFGPGKLEVSIKNLDADALARIRLKLIELQKNNAQGQQVAMALLPELPQLLSKEPELNISELHFKMPEGTIKGNLKLSVPKGNNDNPLSMMQNITGNGKLSVPGPVLKSALAQSIKDKTNSQPELQNALVTEMGKNEPSGVTVTEAPATIDPNAAANQAEQQISKMVQSGLLVADGDNYVIEFSLESGKLTINGKPFEPNMVKF